MNCLLAAESIFLFRARNNLLKYTPHSNKNGCVGLTGFSRYLTL